MPLKSNYDSQITRNVYSVDCKSIREIPLKPHMKRIKTVLILIILTLTSLVGRHEAIAGGLASKPVKKSQEFVTPTEEQMETELDEKQKEEKLTIEAKIPGRKEAKTFENEAERIICLLRQEGVILYDWVVSLEAIDSFESLKIALRAYESRSFGKIPDNKQILKQLKNLLSKIRKMNLTEDELKILSSNDLMNKIESFYSIGLKKKKSMFL